MSNRVLITTGAAFSLLSLAVSIPVQAANFGDFMNPGKWFGGNNNRDYYDRSYRYGYPGYGYPGYGYGGYGYPGYGYGGYGPPGYGYGGYGPQGYQNQGGSAPAPAPAPQ